MSRGSSALSRTLLALAWKIPPIRLNVPAMTNEHTARRGQWGNGWCSGAAGARGTPPLRSSTVPHDGLCLLSVHAHPDDESSKGASTVARYHAEGVRTVLVCCTGGEEGDILNPAMDTPEVRADIGAVRLAELKAATDIIGYDETVMLGYRDSGMPGTEANARPESFAQAPLDEAVGRLVAVIRRERPQVILTYPEDQSEYPHPDHLRVHEISVAGLRCRRRARPVPRGRTPLRAVEALLLGVAGRAVPPDPRQVLGAGTGVALQRGAAVPADPGGPLHDVDRRAGLRGRAGPGAEGACHPGRPELPVLVRPAARGARRTSTRSTTSAWPEAGSDRSTSPRTTCSPGCADQPPEPSAA